MSTTTDLEAEMYECSHCGGPRRPATSVRGSFCSSECYRSHRRQKQAEAILEPIRKNHRFCATCFGRLKEVERPEGASCVVGPSSHDDWGDAADVFVGWQYLTETAEVGEISRHADGDRDGDREVPIVEDGVVTGTICSCGATDHRDVSPTIRATVDDDVLVRQLAAAAETRRHDGAHDVDYDLEVLEDAIAEDGVDVQEALASAVVLTD